MDGKRASRFRGLCRINLVILLLLNVDGVCSQCVSLDDMADLQAVVGFQGRVLTSQSGSVDIEHVAGSNRQMACKIEFHASAAEHSLLRKIVDPGFLSKNPPNISQIQITQIRQSTFSNKIKSVGRLADAEVVKL